MVLGYHTSVSIVLHWSVSLSKVVGTGTRKQGRGYGRFCKGP